MVKQILMKLNIIIFLLYSFTEQAFGPVTIQNYLSESMNPSDIWHVSLERDRPSQSFLPSQNKDI
jgi:hypothetical protein